MKLTKEQAEEVLEKSKEINKKYPEWRIGQSFFNTLYMMYPDVADDIRGTKYDTFHRTELINQCIEFITEKPNI